MTTLTVGTGLQFETIHAAVAASQDGDVVQVQAGTYVNDFAAINTNITLEGVGGMVHLLATEAPSDGKAILTTSADVTIKNFEFSGAAVADGNGAGIRHQAGDLVVENAYFHDNQEGLLANDSDGTITIRNSEFASNGTGDGYTHNLYVGHIAALTVEDSYFHDAIIGHEIKSRASETTITGSRIADGDGTASYSIDLPNGGVATLTGNTIEQGAHSDNPAIIHFGGEGNDYAGSSLTVADNMVVNNLDSDSARLLVNDTGVTAEVHGNSVFGLSVAQIASGLAEVSGSVALALQPLLDLSHPWSASSGSDSSGSAPLVDEPVSATPADTVPADTSSTGTAPAETVANDTAGTDTTPAHAAPADPVAVVPEPADTVPAEAAATPHWTPASDGGWNFRFGHGGDAGSWPAEVPAPSSDTSGPDGPQPDAAPTHAVWSFDGLADGLHQPSHHADIWH